MLWRRLMGRRAMDRMVGAAQVIEPELDMSRSNPHTSAFVGNLSKFIGWLAPESRAIGAPMRSVARELEEAFPTGDK